MAQEVTAPLILASASPRRKRLLTEAGLEFDVVPADVDESYLPGESPGEHVQRLAVAKAATVSDISKEGSVILGADTVVVLDGRIYGKPADMDEAKQTLAEFSGRTHDVLTGVCIRLVGNGIHRAWVTTTRVTFHPLTMETIGKYCSLVNPLDKAGSYGIQEHGDMLVVHIEGLLSNVIGLPVEDVLAELDDL